MRPTDFEARILTISHFLDEYRSRWMRDSQVEQRYWGAAVPSSVAGWNRLVVRARTKSVQNSAGKLELVERSIERISGRANTMGWTSKIGAAQAT